MNQQDIHIPDSLNLNEALIWAAEIGQTEVVKVLIKAGANVHARDDWALRWASYDGHTEVVKLLLEAGANVRTVGAYALGRASLKGHTEVVKVLKKAMKKENN